ncbi:hypothetical protein, partial [Klebsiella pneumoniae]|uniref:hypothetical protein n=1 Tax=Klebsiella pneumoniae TaxID=573 RepID=UPI001D0E60D9
TYSVYCTNTKIKHFILYQEYEMEVREAGYFIEGSDGSYRQLTRKMKNVGECYSLELPPFGVIVEFMNC